MTSSQAKTQPVNLAQLVVEITGPWGRWQLKFFILYSIFSMIYAWHALQLTFQAPNIEYWCADGGGSLANQSTEKCLVNDRTACTKWGYDVGREGSFYHSTIISEWDLVCGRQWMASFSHSAYMMGFLGAGLVMAHCSDRIGRKPTILIGWTISLAATLSAAFSASVIQFFISRFIIAFGMTTSYATGFVLMLEIVGPQYREIIGLAVEFGWAAGYITLPGLAWIVRDFRHLLLICAGVEFSLILLYGAIIESPRWLLAKGRFAEATVVLKNAVRVNQNSNNNVDVEERLASVQNRVDLIDSSDSKTKESQYSILDLFHGWTMTRTTLVIWFVWFANSLVYYGLSLNTNNLAGDPFINFLLMGLIEIPAYIATIYLVKQFGNKRVFIATCIGAGLGCWASIAIEVNYYLGIVGALFGKFCIASSYAIVFVYTVQVFPTVVRTIALGSGSVVARFGSISAPYIKELTLHTSFAFSMIAVGMIAFLAGLILVPMKESTGSDMPDKPEDVGRTDSPNAKLADTSTVST